MDYFIIFYDDGYKNIRIRIEYLVTSYSDALGL